ncbi:cupin domain-containing protein [Alienimonas sp. DA493]|uniref:cupin domain-containing protein n=1 Tax=Alienimonas sp. DA493 TaxID=3373605 RepID=UPI0037552D11
MTPADLLPHPEGGRYREVFRSADTVRGGERAACTHIYFHLAAGEVSRWHRVTSDEVWNLYRGALRLWLWEEGGEPEAVELSADENRFCCVVPAGVWQAAEPLGEDALVGCTVAPGFDFADFAMLHENDPPAAPLTAAAPELARLLAPAVA